MRAEFDLHEFLITAAVSAGKLTIDVAYDIEALARSVNQRTVWHNIYDILIRCNSSAYAVMFFSVLDTIIILCPALSLQ